MAPHHKVAKFLSKLQSLPLDETLSITNSALKETEATVVEAKAAMAAVTQLLASPEVAELSPELVATLSQAQAVLASFGPQAALQEQVIGSLRQLNQVITNANDVYTQRSIGVHYATVSARQSRCSSSMTCSS